MMWQKKHVIARKLFISIYLTVKNISTVGYIKPLGYLLMLVVVYNTSYSLSLKFLSNYYLLHLIYHLAYNFLIYIIYASKTVHS